MIYIFYIFKHLFTSSDDAASGESWLISKITFEILHVYSSKLLLVVASKSLSLFWPNMNRFGQNGTREPVYNTFKTTL